MFTDKEGRLRPAWAFILSALLAGFAFFTCSYLAASIAGDHILRFEGIFRCSLAGLLLAGFSWLLAVGNHVEEYRIAAQGLPLASGWLRQLAIGCGLGFVLVVSAVVAVALFGGLTFHPTLTLHNLLRVPIVLLVLIAGSLAEELMFRGYPFQRLVEAIGAGGAILVFSVLFALVHWMNPGASPLGLLNTVLIGVVLSVAYLRTRALWLPWGLHFAWNATLGLVFGLPVSGIRLFNVFVHTTAVGPQWLTGGTYGLEASLPGISVVLVGLIVVWRAPLRRLIDPAEFFSSRNDPVPEPPNVNTPTHPPAQLGL
jgi:membrane protease YdiL (CAAX protease family)